MPTRTLLPLMNPGRPSRTEACYFLPGPPPAVTTRDLSSLLQDLEEAGIVDSSKVELKVKFGTGIDQDSKPGILWYANDRAREMAWDWNIARWKIGDAAEFLRGEEHPVYRADLTLGDLKAPIVESVATPGAHPGPVVLIVPLHNRNPLGFDAKPTDGLFWFCWERKIHQPGVT